MKWVLILGFLAKHHFRRSPAPLCTRLSQLSVCHILVLLDSQYNSFIKKNSNRNGSITAMVAVSSPKGAQAHPPSQHHHNVLPFFFPVMN
jgi:hypothetical protein